MKFEWNGKKIDIARLVGGISWPGIRTDPNRKVLVPGSVVMVGEERMPDKSMRPTYHLYLIDSFESQNMDELIDKAIDWRISEKVDMWLGRKDRDHDKFIHHWNKEIREKSKPKFKYFSAIQSKTNSIAYHFNVISHCIQKDVKILHNLAEKRAGIDLQTITSKSMMSIDANEYPAIAALGYAVTYLREHKRRPEIDQSDESKYSRRNPNNMAGY
jgi:hypothetical protein